MHQGGNTGPAAICWLIAKILAPVGRVAQLDVWTQDGTNLRSQGDELRHGLKLSGGASDPCQAAHLGPDAKGMHAPCRRTERGLMQDETAIAPFLRSAIGDIRAIDGEIGGRGRPEEIRNLLFGQRGAIRAARAPRCL